MRGAPARAIQELAGHMNLTITQRYMHVSPVALDSGIGLLEQPAGSGQITRVDQNFGDAVETATGK